MRDKFWVKFRGLLRTILAKFLEKLLEILRIPSRKFQRNWRNLDKILKQQPFKLRGIILGNFKADFRKIVRNLE